MNVEAVNHDTILAKLLKHYGWDKDKGRKPQQCDSLSKEFAKCMNSMMEMTDFLRVEPSFLKELNDNPKEYYLVKIKPNK